MLDSGDEELRELAKMEIGELEESIGTHEEELKVLAASKGSE